MAVNLGWTQVPLAADVTAILGVPCTLDNDVRAAAEGVRAQRMLGDARDFLYLSVGTGIAAGVVVDDVVLHGAHMLGGEVGHLIVEPGRSALRLRPARLPGGDRVRAGRRRPRPSADRGRRAQHA